MSPTETSKTQTDPSVVVASRSAIDSSGRAGSLYDGYRDCILGSLNVKKEEELYQSYKNVRCGSLHGNNDRTQNLLRLLEIDEQLRLSILLDLAPKTGIASLIDYPHATKKYTGLFHYTYVHQIQQLPDRIEHAREFIQPLTSVTEATHIITRVEWGIDFVVILELPYDKQTTAAIDRLLENICQLLNNDSDTLTLMSTKENLLTQILHTKVYSNVPKDDLHHVKTLRDVCRYIEQNKNSTIYYPVYYTLRSIKWLNPYYTGKSSTFISLPKNLNDSIEQYVLQLRRDIKNIETTINEDIAKLLCGHLKERLSDLRKQLLDVKQIYINEIKRLSKLVVDIRSDRVRVPTIDQALKKNDQMLVKNTMDIAAQYFDDLKKKDKLITSLMKQKFRYFDVTDYDIDRLDNETTIERKLVLDDERDRVLCSNDTLNTTKPTELKSLRRNMVEEFNNNSNLRLIYADFSYSSFELQNMVKLPSNNDRKEQNKPKQKEATSLRELQNISSSSTNSQISFRPPAEARTSVSATTKPQITDTRFVDIQTDTSSQTKSQTNMTPPTVQQIVTPAATKVRITDRLSTTTQTYISPSTKAQTSILPLAETQVFTPGPIKSPINDSLSTNTHTYISAKTKPQSPLPPFTEVQSHVSAPTNSKISILSPRKEPAYIPPFTKTTTSRLTDNETINILLLGETGVGKSTFINALANYLTFNTLQQAETGQPVVLIPVSFLITVGDNFEERIVKFGDVDGLKNEDFEHPGQSVTQHCKSYNFDLNHNDKKIFRIIDTPGFGDTRGVDQDDLNMEHILAYVRKLSHLNAICFLLKPNESRLNIFFRSCLTQLFSLFDRNIDENIIFCFTNSRSTFYSPGNTAPLLKRMLTSLPNNDIPFTKGNTFCFDNESFRYLVARQNGVKFNDLEKSEYEESWAKSVVDANRLINYIRTNLIHHPIRNRQ